MCPPCRDAVAATANEAPSLTLGPPAPKTDVVSLDAARAKKRRLRALLGGALVLAAAAVALIVTRAPSDPDVLAKGTSFAFEVHVNDGKTTALASDGQVVSPGQRAGFKLRAEESGFVAILGWDDRLTPYAIYPATFDAPAPALAATRDATVIPAAVAFDGNGTRETLAAVYCQAPFRVSELVAGAAPVSETLPAAVAKRQCALRTLTLSKR